MSERKDSPVIGLRDSDSSLQALNDQIKQIERIRSTNTRHRRIATMENEVEFRRENIYKIGNTKLDKRFLVFITKWIIILSILIFCMIRISVDNDDSGVFLNLLCSILGVFLNAPKLSNE